MKLTIHLSFIVIVALTSCSDETNHDLNIKQVQVLVNQTSHRNSLSHFWAEAISSSIKELEYDVTQQHVCAVSAVIAQESGFKEVPQNKNMGDILRRNIDSYKTNKIVSFFIQKRLDQGYKDGNTFRKAISEIHSERDFEDWYSVFTASYITWPFLWLMNKDINNLVTTLGSMQVSVAFAEDFEQKPLGVNEDWNIRQILYTRKGGVFYGTAYLLKYRRDYKDWKYTFADYNAGHYASRNAGFQKMVSNITKSSLSLDGDLLQYKDDDVISSKTLQAVSKYMKDIGESITKEQIMGDLKQEKEYDFVSTKTYRIISEIHNNKFGRIIKQLIPEISLKSQKFNRSDLTTKWFADRVKQRYSQCMEVNV